VSVVTVKVHRAQVMHKLGAKSIADLVRIADQVGAAPIPKA
jgi:FixJ family two-component response regulator